MTIPYWLAEDGVAVESRQRLAQVDVVVVGGGVTGCSCALTLAQGGLRVRIEEARQIAAGASGRNAGFALRGAVMSYRSAQRLLGSERARLLWQLTERALDRMALLAGDAFRRSGSLRLAAGDTEREELAGEFEALRADGFSAGWIEEPAGPLRGRYNAALLHPDDGSIHPSAWVARLARLALGAGAELAQGRQADLAALDAPTVVLAVDGLSAQAAPELADLVRPVRGQVLLTEPLAERLFERPHYARGGYDYWQQLANGRLLVGGRRDTSFDTEATTLEETTTLVQEQIEDLTRELLGRLPAVTHRWAGIWGETPDLLPLAGRLPGRDAVWLAGGFSGHGNVLGFACGDLVARSILGLAPSELALFDPSRQLPPWPLPRER